MWRPLTFTLCFLCLYSWHASAQVDTAHLPFVGRMQKVAAHLKEEVTNERNLEKTTLLQDDLYDHIDKTMQRAKSFLKRGIDTDGIQDELTQIGYWNKIAGEGVFSNVRNLQTYRNLTTTNNLLTVLQNRLENRKEVVDNYQRHLSVYRYQIDSLACDSAMFVFPDDSALMAKQLEKLGLLAYEIKPADSLLRAASTSVQILQNQVNLLLFRIAAERDEIEHHQNVAFRHSFRREFAQIDNGQNQPLSFFHILQYSKRKGLLALRFYVADNLGKIGILLVFMVIASIYLWSLKRIYRQKNMLNADHTGQLVLRYPLISSVFIVLNVFQFIFLSPPFMFNAILWSVSAICLTLIFWHYITRFWMEIWLILLGLFALACFNNAILQASTEERIGMFVWAMAGIVVSTYSLLSKRGLEVKEPWIRYFIVLLAVLELTSVILNLAGLYNLSKTLLTSGYFNVIIAIMFLWTVRLINEGVGMAYRVYATNQKPLFFINYEKVGSKAPAFFYLFMVMGWLILFGRNFYAFEFISAPIRNFMSEERAVGDYIFTFNTLLLFILILVLSVLVSKIVSYFASDKGIYLDAEKQGKRVTVGGWLLLLRFAIITVGIFFAFAAAGIPLDKITIILGALGVGIGFGLQGLVSNLVSGLVIAFEKPLNIGDVVNVGEQSGTMKSIGFRASVLSTWDGADVVIPNGDLLNAHLVNWTIGGNKRRINIDLELGMDTELDKTKTLIKAILAADNRVISTPTPQLWFQDINDGRIALRIYYWVGTLDDAYPSKSDLIQAIHQAFQQNGITIPFPQQDIHVHMPESLRNRPGNTPGNTPGGVTGRTGEA
jgi:potassium-dependent mechanosensitive channel